MNNSDYRLDLVDYTPQKFQKAVLLISIMNSMFLWNQFQLVKEQCSKQKYPDTEPFDAHGHLMMQVGPNRNGQLRIHFCTDIHVQSIFLSQTGSKITHNADLKPTSEKKSPQSSQDRKAHAWSTSHIIDLLKQTKAYHVKKKKPVTRTGNFSPKLLEGLDNLKLRYQ